MNNNLQAAPNSSRETYPGYRNPDNFIVVSDAYPTVTAMAADLGRTAMWVRCVRRQRRTHVWRQLVNAPGEARRLWQMMEFSKRFTTDEGGRRSWTTIPITAARRCSTCCSATARWTIPAIEIPADYENREAKAFGSTCRRACSRNTPSSAAAMDVADFDTLHEVRGLRWPVVNGKETKWRYREGLDPYVKAGKGVDFYGNKDGKARIIAVPYEPRRTSTRNSTSGWSPAAYRTLALRLHDHARARTLQGIPGAWSSCIRKTRAPEASPGRRGPRGFPPRRNLKPDRYQGPQPDAARRRLRSVVRRQPAHQQGDAGRNRSHFQADGLQEMRGQDHSG